MARRPLRRSTIIKAIAPGDAPAVNLAGDVYVPHRFTAAIDDPDCEFVAEMVVEVPLEEGPPRCIRLVFSPRDDGEAITNAGIRSAAIAGWVEAACSTLSYRRVDDADETRITHIDPHEARAALRRELGDPRPPVRRRRVATEDIELAVEVYRSAVAAGQHDPITIVASAIGRSEPTASRWIRKARKEGILGPALGNIAGEKTT